MALFNGALAIVMVLMCLFGALNLPAPPQAESHQKACQKLSESKDLSYLRQSSLMLMELVQDQTKRMRTVYLLGLVMLLAFALGNLGGAVYGFLQYRRQ